MKTGMTRYRTSGADRRAVALELRKLARRVVRDKDIIDLELTVNRPVEEEPIHSDDAWLNFRPGEFEWWSLSFRHKGAR